MSNTATAGEGTDVYVDGFDGIGLLKTCDLNFAQDTPDVTGFKKTFKVCIAGLYGCTISTSGFYDKFSSSAVNNALYNHIIARTLGTLVVYPKADVIGNFGYGFTGFFTEYSPDAEVTKAVEFSANFNSNVGGDRGYVLHGQYDAAGAPIAAVTVAGNTGSTPVGRGTNARGVRLISYANMLSLTGGGTITLITTSDAVTPMTNGAGAGNDIANGSFAAFSAVGAQRIDTGKITGIATAALGVGGTGHAPNDILTLTTPDGAGGTVKVLTVDGGTAVVTFSILTVGTGFSTGLHATTSGGGGGTTATINVTAVGPQDYLGVRWTKTGTVGAIFSVLTARKLA